jgi:hypothetical protein
VQTLGEGGLLMAILGERQFVERLRFFEGQRLFASDLDALDRFHREMRWLHNQSLHQPGVGRGLAITGRKGEKTVSVQEGYAIDLNGREIVLTLPKTLPVPPRAGDEGQPLTYDLTVAYPADEDLEITETRQGICAAAGAVRRREEPVFCWVEIGADGQPKDDALKARMAAAELIRLARARILECKLFADVSIAERRNARPPQQPYIACGTVEEPEWRLKEKKKPLTAPQVGFVHALPSFLSADISTVSAGFRTEPCYLVELRGQRVHSRGNSTFVIDGLVSVTAKSASRLSIDVDVLVQRLSGGEGVTIDKSFFADWGVTWIGVEG